MLSCNRQRALRTAANGYLLKSDATDLLFAVETVLSGEQFVSNRRQEGLITLVARGSLAKGKCLADLSLLTDEMGDAATPLCRGGDGVAEQNTSAKLNKTQRKINNTHS